MRRRNAGVVFSTDTAPPQRASFWSQVHEASVELAKPDDAREAEFRDRNRAFLERRLNSRLEAIHGPHEAALVANALDAAKKAGVSTHGYFRKGGVEDAVRASPLRAGVALDGDLDACRGGAGISTQSPLIFAALDGLVFLRNARANARFVFSAGTSRTPSSGCLPSSTRSTRPCEIREKRC